MPDDTSTPMPTVRIATADDWPAVEGLLAELGRPDVRGAPEESGARATYLAYLERDDAEALVAEVGGRVVGFVDMEYRVRLNFTTRQAWIPDLVVTEDGRSRGVGAALLSRCLELARERVLPAGGPDRRGEVVLRGAVRGRGELAAPTAVVARVPGNPGRSSPRGVPCPGTLEGSPSRWR
jgi:GNAT superfamily N-acetyltransferase